MSGQDAAGYVDIRLSDAIQFEAGRMQFAGSLSITMQTEMCFGGSMINSSTPNPVGAGWVFNVIWLNSLNSLNSLNPTPSQVNQYLNGFSYGIEGIVRLPEGLPVSVVLG